MTRTRVIIVLALTVVMLAMMTGLAMAESVVVAPGQQPLQPSQTVGPDGLYSTYTIEVSYIVLKVGGNLHTIEATTMDAYGGGTTDDLRFRFNYGTDDSGWKGTGQTWDWNDGGNTQASLTLDVLDTGTATDVTYKFEVRDSYPTAHWGADHAEGVSFGSAIPEFTTIAIPVASILGLLFYFNHRKRRKE